MIRITVFNEYAHERLKPHVNEIYPRGIHSVIKEFLKSDEIEVKTTTLFDETGNLIPECGLTDEVLKNTDVLIWWAHAHHQLVPDEVAIRVRDHVHNGMGIIFLHSAHHSKPFKLLMGTTGNLRWRVDDKERLWNINPAHPIMKGVGDYIDIPKEEMYGERFEIPNPDDVLMIGAFSGYEVFRSACTWQRVNGRIFYFQPGHEEYPVYYMPEIQTIIKNAVYWVNPTYRVESLSCDLFPKMKF